MRPWYLLPLFACSAAVAPAPVPVPPPDPCATVPRVDTQGWRRVGRATMQFLLPQEYRAAEARSIDSSVSAWTTPDGRRIDVDLGMHTKHFLGRSNGSVKRLIAICHDASDGVWPQVVLFQSVLEDRFAAGLYWPIPGGRLLAEPGGLVRAEALWLVASSADSTDLPELLGIVRSVRVGARSPNSALEGTEGRAYFWLGSSLQRTGPLPLSSDR